MILFKGWTLKILIALVILVVIETILYIGLHIYNLMQNLH